MVNLWMCLIFFYPDFTFSAAFVTLEALAIASEDKESDEKALGRMEGSSTAREFVWDRSREPDDVFPVPVSEVFPVPAEMPSTVNVTSLPEPEVLIPLPPPSPISDSRLEKDESDSRSEPVNNK